MVRIKLWSTLTDRCVQYTMEEIQLCRFLAMADIPAEVVQLVMPELKADSRKQWATTDVLKGVAAAADGLPKKVPRYLDCSANLINLDLEIPDSHLWLFHSYL